MDDYDVKTSDDLQNRIKKGIPSEGARRSVRDAAKKRINYSVQDTDALVHESDEDAADSDSSDTSQRRGIEPKAASQRRSQSSYSESDQLDDSDYSRRGEKSEDDEVYRNVGPTRQHRDVGRIAKQIREHR